MGRTTLFGKVKQMFKGLLGKKDQKFPVRESRIEPTKYVGMVWERSSTAAYRKKRQKARLLARAMQRRQRA